MLKFIKEEILNVKFPESGPGPEPGPEPEPEPESGPVSESEPERISNQN